MKYEQWEKIQQRRAEELQQAKAMYPNSPDLWKEPEAITEAQIHAFNEFLQANPNINGYALAERLLDLPPERRTRETVMQWLDNPATRAELWTDEPQGYVDPESLEWQTPSDVPTGGDHTADGQQDDATGIDDDAGADDYPDDCPERGNYVL